MREVDSQTLIDLDTRCGRVREISETAEDPFDPGQKLGGEKWLGDVVLGQFADRAHHGPLLVDRGEQDDGQVTEFQETTAQLEPVHSRHHDVDHRQMGETVLFDNGESLFAGSGTSHVVSAGLESHANHLQKIGLVVDDQHPVGLG